jgi:hypothetical protein
MSFCSVNVRIAIQRQKAHIMSSKGCIVCHFVRLPYKIHFLHQFKMCAPNICMESLAKKHMIKNVVLPFKTRLFPRAPICLSIVWGWVYGCRILFGVSCMPVQHFFCFLCACPLFGFLSLLSNIVWVSCRCCPILFWWDIFFVRLSCHFYVVEPKLLHTIFFLYHVEYCCYRLRGSCYGEGYFCIFPSAVGAVGVIHLQVHC